MRKFFRPVHLQAILFLVIYNIASKWFFVKSLLHPSIIVNYLVPYFFGIGAGYIFLYLLSHEDFFHFMKDVEKMEEKKEKGFLRKYLHHGKILAVLIITTIGGPIFGALTIRLLLSKYKYQFLLLSLCNISSAIFLVSLSKGLISFI